MNFVPPLEPECEHKYGCFAGDVEGLGGRGCQEFDLDDLTFKLIVRSRDKPEPGPPYTVTLMAPSAQEKAAWTSDISQVTYQIITVPASLFE